jgi:hypothetical protein
MTDTVLIDRGDNANDQLMAKDFADALLAAYPGWLWAVTVDGMTGMVDILNLNLSGRYGWRLKLPAIYSSSSFKAEVLNAGGEILERFGQPRGAFDRSRWMQLPTNVNGCPVGDVTPTVQRLSSAYGCR